MRPVNVVCAFLALASLTSPALSQTAATAPPPAKPTAGVHVYLVRGLLNVFSLGLDAMAERLHSRGVKATVHNHMEYLLLADEAIQACKAGRESEIMLDAPSLGASAVVEMANRMAESGVQASLVVSIDPVVKVTASGHVSRLINYYVSTGVGQVVARGSSFRGTIQNVDLKNIPDGGHFMTNSDSIQARVVNDVITALHSPHVGCRIGAAHSAEKPTVIASPPHS